MKGKCLLVRNPVFKSYGWLPLAVVVCLAGTESSHAQTASVEPSFSIAITAAKQTVKLGDDIRITVTLTNSSPRQMYLENERNDPAQDYMVSVQDENGKRPMFTKDFSTPRELSSSYFEEIKPGDGLKSEIVLNAIYDISTPGKYTVQLWKAIRPNLFAGAAPAMQGVVKSNTITVTVVK